MSGHLHAWTAYLPCLRPLSFPLLSSCLSGSHFSTTTLLENMRLMCVPSLPPCQYLAWSPTAQGLYFSVVFCMGRCVNGPREGKCSRYSLLSSSPRSLNAETSGRQGPEQWQVLLHPYGLMCSSSGEILASLQRTSGPGWGAEDSGEGRGSDTDCQLCSRH